MTRQLKTILVLSGFLLCAPRMVQSQSSPSANSPEPQPNAGSQRPDPAPERQADQMTDIPYFTLRDGLSSRLTLDNNAPTPTLVKVTIFNREGRSQTLDPMTLDPHSVSQIELRDVVASELFDEGNLSIAYYGKEMDVTCQVSVYSLTKRVSFESREQGMMDFQSTGSNGILWLPQKEAEGFLAITNISKNKVQVKLSLGSQTNEIGLDSRETHLVNLGKRFDLHSPISALLKLSHNGIPGDIITTGFVMDLENGYSSAFIMVDPGNMRSSHLAGAHLRSGPPNPKEGFPPGTTFSSPLLLANVSDKPVSIHVAIDYTMREKLKMSRLDAKEEADGMESGASQYQFGTITASDLTIAPGAVARIDLSEALEKHGVQQIAEAGVDIDYTAAPGSVLAHLVSADQSGDYAFEVPIKDPTAWNSMIEGINPWTLEDGTRTVLHLKNTTDQAVRAWVSFTFFGGRYNLPLVSFQPYETIAIDIQNLKDSKEPDAVGKSFPAEATHGQVIWFPETPYTLVGRSEQTNVSEGIARSFSCQVNCCNNFWEQACVSTGPCRPDDFSNPIATSGLTGSAGGNSGSTELKTYKYGYDCNNNIIGPTNLGTIEAWTYNSSIVSVDTTGVVTYKASGSTQVGTTNAPLIYYDWFQECICHSHSFGYTTLSNETATVNVSLPNHVKVVSDHELFPQCPAGHGPAVDVRQMYLQIVDVNNVAVTTNYSNKETFSGISFNTCPGNPVPQPAPCAQTGPTACQFCTAGEFSDTMAVAGALNGDFCDSGINPASGCGFSLTSAWGMCSNSLNNNIWTSTRTTLSNAVTVNGQRAAYPMNTYLY